MRIESKKTKVAQRLEWIKFRLNAMGMSPEWIESELELIDSKEFEALDQKTQSVMDFETFKLLGGVE